MKKLISILTPTFNEEENIERLVSEIETQMLKFDNKYEYEHIVIDNSSNDRTIEILKSIAKKNKKLKIIINSRNFGHIRSPFYGLLQAKGDAVIFMSSDFQDPIDLIPKYIKSWEMGNRITLGQKTKSKEFFLMNVIRRLYYKFLSSISQIKIPQHTTGSGIYDKEIIKYFKLVNDPYPYLRGLVSEFEDNIKLIEFEQPKRLRGKTKNNLYTLYDIGILGIVKHSTIPLRLIILIGFLMSIISFFSAFVYLFMKLLDWNSFEMGIGALVIGMFSLFSFTIMMIGLIGEYILVILTYSKRLPLVIEKERINFDKK